MDKSKLLTTIYRYWKSSLGISLAFIIFLLSNLVLSTKTLESLYYRGFYQYWRVLNDNTLSRSPISLIYILITVVVIWAVYSFYNRWQSLHTSNYKGLLLQSIGILAWIYCSFYILWGLNYNLLPLKERLELSTFEVNDTMIYNEALNVQNILNKIRIDITSDTQYIKSEIPFTDLEDDVRQSLTKVLSVWGLPIHGKVRVRSIRPKGVLLRIATAGVYLPFVSEGHLDEGLPFLQKPSTLAHEMAHGYGITDEGECNFVGIMACINNKEPLIKYSGYIMYYRYLAYALYKNEPLFSDLKRHLEPGMRQDLIHISNVLDQYPDYFPEIRNKIYDYYLKINGVEEGIESYGTVVAMTQFYVSKYGSLIFDK